MHQEHDRELKALRLVDAEDIHLVARGLEVSGDRVVPRLPQQLEVWDEERRAVRGERAPRALDESQELRDVSGLLFDERRVRVEIALQELRALEELIEERGRRQLRRAAGVVREVLTEPRRRCDGLVARGRLARGDLLEHVAQGLLAAPASFIARAGSSAGKPE